MSSIRLFRRRGWIAIQNEGFENLIRGSQVTIDKVLARAPFNWYISDAVRTDPRGAVGP